MRKITLSIRRQPIFVGAILVLCGLIGYTTYVRSNSSNVSAEAPQVHLLADVASPTVNADTLCNQLKGDTFSSLCRQMTQQAIANANKPITVCRKIFWFEFSCHTESDPTPLNDTVCKKLLTDPVLFDKFIFAKQDACVQSLNVPKPAPTARPGVGSTIVTSPVPVTTITASELELPQFPGALQIAGLGSGISVNGPVYFSAFYSRSKPTTYPPSRFILSLGESFLQVGGKITSAKYDHDASGQTSVVIVGLVDTTNRIITCILSRTNGTLSCSLRSDAIGVSDKAIQLLPTITFYKGNLITSFGDF